MRKIISLIALLLPMLAHAESPEIRDNAPDRHVVVKGDTLWDISAQFFKDPWKWPQIWGMNKDSIQDPHWIYPGDVIVLDRATGMLRIGEGGNTSNHAAGERITKLSPSAQTQAINHNEIPSIPSKELTPFLNRALIIDEKQFATAPTLVAGYERRVLMSTGDVAYAKGVCEELGTSWQIYREGQTFIDPNTKEVLGREAIYLGDAEVDKFGELSTLRITRSVLEIRKGDKLIQTSGELVNNYLPHAPSKELAAQVIAITGGVAQGGQNTVVTLNKGERDGIEKGHVLALTQKGEVLSKADGALALPDTRFGLVFVFRTFEKVSYALIMQTKLPVQLLDRVQTP
jgi:LysM domain